MNSELTRSHNSYRLFYILHNGFPRLYRISRNFSTNSRMAPAFEKGHCVLFE